MRIPDVSAQALIVAVTCLDSENRCHQHLVLQKQPEQLPWPCLGVLCQQEAHAVEMLLLIVSAGQNTACEYIWKVLNTMIALLLDYWQPLFFITSSGVLAAASGGFSKSSRARWHLLRCCKGCDPLMSSILKLENMKQLLHFPLGWHVLALPSVCCWNGPDPQQLWVMLTQKPTCDPLPWRVN